MREEGPMWCDSCQAVVWAIDSGVCSICGAQGELKNNLFDTSSTSCAALRRDK